MTCWYNLTPTQHITVIVIGVADHDVLDHVKPALSISMSTLNIIPLAVVNQLSCLIYNLLCHSKLSAAAC